MTTIRLLALIEASSLTGPAKNLLDFCVRARELDAVRIEPFLVTFRRGEGGDAARPDGFVEAARASGIPVEILTERGRLDPELPASLRTIVEKLNPDVVQTHAVKSHFLMRWSGLWKKRPWVAFHHGYTFTDTRMLAYNLLDLWSLRKPARIVTVSRAFGRQLIARGVRADRIAVVHNAIDADWLERSGLSRDSARRSLGIGQNDRMILAVGRLSREKAFNDLATAVGAMRTSHPELPLRIFIAGEGPERPALERHIAALGLSDSVKLTGAVSQLAPYYAAADILAISSITEGSPNALLEAMAARLPVVATSVGGIPEIVTDEESAILVPPRNPPALAQAMARLLSEPEEAHRMAERAHRDIVERFDPQARACRLAAVYADVIGRR
jgi:glycosyltransferase involved in cell wall biosynthesis